MLPFLRGLFGNPSSSHAAGREVRSALDEARERVRSFVGASEPGAIVFTSGGTEADNWAILGAIEQTGKRHIVTTTVEHEAVKKLCHSLEAKGCSVTWLEVDSEGNLDLGRVREAVTTETAVVSVMMANNETGVLFPVREIAEIVKERSKALFHVDAVNAAGKIPIDVKGTQIDMLSISGHKFHGPKGSGAMYIRKGVALPSMQIGGGQEGGRRAGTEAVHQIVGLGKAAALAQDLKPMEQVRELRDLLQDGVLRAVPNSRLNGTADPNSRLPNTANISFENVNGEMIMAELDRVGICVSTGSACNDAGRHASTVLAAMDTPFSWAMGAVRFSMGRGNTKAEIETVISEVPRVIERLRQLAV